MDNKNEKVISPNNRIGIVEYNRTRNQFREKEASILDMFIARGGTITGILYAVVGYLIIRGFYNILNSGTIYIYYISISAFLLLMFYMAKKYDKNIGLEFAFWSAVIIIAALSTDIDQSFGGLKVLGVIVFSSYFSLSLAGGSLEHGRERVLRSILRGIFVYPFSKFTTFFLLIGDNHNKKKIDFKGVFLGVLLAIPMVFIVVMILVEADSRFNNVMSGIFTFGEKGIESLFNEIIIFSIGILLASLMCGNFFGGLMESEKKKEGLENNDYKGIGFVPATAMGVVMSFLIVVYAIFIATQFSYLFSFLKGELPEGYIYSEYAVKGFFELCTISLINGFILILSKFKKGDFGTWASAILIAITIILLFTSAGKLILYISVYGFTPKRVLGGFVLLWLITNYVAAFLQRFLKVDVESIALYSAAAYFATWSLIPL